MIKKSAAESKIKKNIKLLYYYIKDHKMCIIFVHLYLRSSCKVIKEYKNKIFIMRSD